MQPRNTGSTGILQFSVFQGTVDLAGGWNPQRERYLDSYYLSGTSPDTFFWPKFRVHSMFLLMFNADPRQSAVTLLFSAGEMFCALS